MLLMEFLYVVLHRRKSESKRLVMFDMDPIDLIVEVNVFVGNAMSDLYIAEENVLEFIDSKYKHE